MSGLGDSDASENGERTPDAQRCEAPECDRGAAIRLHIPWADDEVVCPAHARVLSRPDGIVAEPIEGAEAEWP